MAAFNFPNSPSDGDTHTENGFTFVWDGTNGAWKKNPASLFKGEKGEPGTSIKGDKGDNKGEKGQKGEPGDVTAKGAKGEPSTVKGQKGEPGADTSTKGQKGEPGSGGSSTINNNSDDRVITGSNTTGELNAETNLTYDGNDLSLTYGNNHIGVNAGDGAIEMTRATGGAYIDFKNTKTEDFDVRIQQDGTSDKLKVYNYAQTGGDLDVTGTITNIAVAKAFVNFHGGTNTNGNCTLRDAFGVSSVADMGTGSYRIYWTSSFSNVNYTVATSHSSAPNNGSTHGILYTYGYNAAYVNVINHRDDYGPDVVDKNEVCAIVFTTF
tara:strand:+ start:3448 stop:4416 length:969 start_codon:yes stop_codon:yes gene_type:complete